MKIYNYHPEYKYFISESLADESPLEPGIYLIPAQATDKPIPDFSEGTIPVFNGSDWEIIPDNRGVWYSIEDGQSYEIYDPNESVLTLTKIKPPSITPFQKLSWNGKNWDVVDVPLPQLTIEEKLANAGITIDELKQALGLN